MRREHAHTCCHKECGATWICDAELERNYDGWPEVICVRFPGDTHECQDCFESRCSDCGEILHIGEHDTDCPKAAKAVTA